MATAAEVHDAVALRTGDGFARRRARWLLRFVRTQPLGTFGVLFILLVICVAIFAPVLNTVNPKELGAKERLQAPNGDAFFGTTRDGKDMWSRVLYGTRPALLIGFGAVALAVGVGVTLALLAGFLGGFVDSLISRLTEILIAVPGLLWLMMFTTAIDRSVQTVMFAIAFTFAPLSFRVMRGNVLQERSISYVEAAHVIGASQPRIMFRHILPNMLPLVIVIASITVPAAILLEASLTFLGLGLDVREASWGADLGPNHRPYFRTAWWLPVLPGAALSLTVLAFNFFGDSMRDVLDPRLRGSGLV